MKKDPVVFIASKEYDNLGIGYMAAMLNKAGFSSETIDSSFKKKKILKKLASLNPVIIGFSVIYQYNIDRFAKLVRFLREGGIKCHLTAGGHYASLRYRELFDLVPELDSIVRFDGEYTICELAKNIHSGTEWRNIKSIVYYDKGEIIENPLRPLEADLDKLPYPLRAPLSNYAFNKTFSTILAGRGCLHNCSFCNLREYYRPFPGLAKRTRKPEMVVKEMDYLFREKGCSVFLFQDDDFPVKIKKGSDWIIKFCEELKSKGLNDKIIWKINCRPDEINEKIFTLLKNSGLFLVFIGIEDGTNIGLKRLNKQMTLEESIAGIETLKKLNIGFDFGFMLFQPSTTFKSLKENLEFLKNIVGDGYSPVTLIKTMPYYDSLIEKELLKEGRIKGKPGYRDYDFLEDSMNDYYEFIIDCFSEWTRDPTGVENISKWARNYIAVFSNYSEMTNEASLIIKNARNTISKCNIFFLNTLQEVANLFEAGKSRADYSELKRYMKIIKTKHKHYKKQIINIMTYLSFLFELQRKS
jgi:radical SAM superfamily enzyme YgiQ (UPF0313 family)